MAFRSFGGPDCAEACHYVKIRSMSVAGQPQEDWPPELRELGARVRLVRKGRKMTKKALAAKIGCDPSTLTRLEKGERLMELPRLVLLARALGPDIKVGWIIAGEGPLPELRPAPPEDRDQRRRPDESSDPGVS